MYQKTLRPLGLLVLVVLAAGCNVAERQIEFDQITLERTVCYGACPDYRIVVFADGRVEYEGRRYVQLAGKATKQLSPEALRQLHAEFARVKYFALRDRYATRHDGCPAVWTDNPTAITSVRAAGKMKVVHHYYGCRGRDRASTFGEPYPANLTRFERQIDEIVGTSQWVGEGLL